MNDIEYIERWYLAPNALPIPVRIEVDPDAPEGQAWCLTKTRMVQMKQVFETEHDALERAAKYKRDEIERAIADLGVITDRIDALETAQIYLTPQGGPEDDAEHRRCA